MARKKVCFDQSDEKSCPLLLTDDDDDDRSSVIGPHLFYSISATMQAATTAVSIDCSDCGPETPSSGVLLQPLPWTSILVDLWFL